MQPTRTTHQPGLVQVLAQRLDRLLLRPAAWDTAVIFTLAVIIPVALFRLPVAPSLPAGLALAVGILVIHAACGFYERQYTRPFSQTFARAAVAVVAGLLVAWFVVENSPAALWGSTVEEPVTLAYAFLSTAAVVLWRTASVHRSTASQEIGWRVLILGTGETAHRVSRVLTDEAHGVHIVGHVAGPVEPDSRPAGLTVLEPGPSLRQLAQLHRADEVVVALSERRGGATPLSELLDCRIGGIVVNDINTHFERRLGQIRLEHLSAHWLIFGDGFNQGTARTMVKRIFDILSALILLVPGLPLMALAAAAIRLESPGSVLYRQERVGLGGRAFNVVKLRSMRVDAEKDGRPRWASTNDARITRVGRFIRLTRIDELPQLFNVLRGDMSLVGPRPERPFFVEQLTQQLPFYAVRHSVKPGLTGWAQVRCDYGSSVEEARNKLQFDLYYVKNHSLMLDLMVVLETIGVVLTGKGAR